MKGDVGPLITRAMHSADPPFIVKKRASTIAAIYWYVCLNTRKWKQDFVPHYIKNLSDITEA